MNNIYPDIKECHCMAVADKYFTRTFINKAGYKVIKIFYKCRNCKSRIHDYFIPELENKSVDVFKLLKQKDQ